MTRGSFAVCALMLLAATQAVWGGTVYVPLALDQAIEGNHFRTEITVYNDAAGPREFTYLFIEERADGTKFDRQANPNVVVVGARRTETYVDLVPANRIGMLEITADEELFLTARLVGSSPAGAETFGIGVPVVTSRNAIGSGSTSVLAGLKRIEGQVQADFHVINLSTHNAACAIEVLKTGGAKLLDEVFLFGPLSVFRFPDALGLLNVDNASNLSIATTCDQLAYPFATLHELDSAATLYLPPAGAGTSLLEAPGAPFVCPAGSTCFERADTFYTPNRDEPMRTIYMPVPAGTYRKIRLHLEVVHGGWQTPSSGLHNIFWLALEKNRDMVGYVNLLGPGRNLIMLRHGFGLSHGEKPKVEQPFAADPGEKYVFDYLYDTDLGVIELLVSNRGQEVARVFATPNVNKIDVAANKRFRIDISFKPGLNPTEPPTYGWQYQDLRVEYVP